MTGIPTLTRPRADQDAEQQEAPLRLEDTHGAASGEDGWAVATKRHRFTVRSSIALLGVHLKGVKTSVHTETCAWLFVAALSAVAQTRKTPRCRVLQALAPTARPGLGAGVGRRALPWLWGGPAALISLWI